MRNSLIAACLLAAALAGCKDQQATGASAPAAQPPAAATAVASQTLAPPPPLTLAAQVGARMFFDPTLSGSGKMSCATCHDPAHAYGPPNDLAVQLGGHDLKQAGTRAVPTLMYKDYTKPYSDTYENPDMISPPGPGGGFAWDGRADTLAEQAAIPLMAPNEMANDSPAALTEAIRHAPYAELFRQAFGADALERPERAVELAGAALQAFQVEDKSFHPYSSKFDRYRNNKIGGTLTAAEAHGLRVFLDPQKGNCMACHLLGGGNDGSLDITSDYSFAAIGVPRNKEIPANADPAYFDLGLCGPLRTDHQPGKGKGKDAAGGCGMFKTPILRNVATRHVFMHNGVFKSLEDVVKFYNTRDTQPELWYPRDAHGKVRKFDDLPARYRANLDDQMPLDQRRAGSKPPMTDQEMADLLTFLATLNDGYQPPAQPAQAGPPATAPASTTHASR
ncbi:cytochrome-c peroxidase [Cupriavidus sp. 30B13]|uniref:cytochrome-c peroxidase n=1 Tax=Cupriavidus sp. 30B13 TaxID=3384241 RepID=UPI003B8EF3EE